MQITVDSMGVYTKVFSLSICQNFDVIRQWSVSVVSFAITFGELTHGLVVLSPALFH